jgi:hypothetical protein
MGPSAQHSPLMIWAGNAILMNGVAQNANREIGVPGGTPESP